MIKNTSQKYRVEHKDKSVNKSTTFTSLTQYACNNIISSSNLSKFCYNDHHTPKKVSMPHRKSERIYHSAEYTF